MIDEVRNHLAGCRNGFESNVKDFFGQKIRQDVFEPFDVELAAVQQAMEEAHNEQQAIKNLLSTLRAMV